RRRVAQRHLPQPGAHRRAAPHRRRPPPDRQVQAHVRRHRRRGERRVSEAAERGRGHLSIGEVLSLLQADFPDITISKIRFLESQGLLDPERTPSGYRKFYDADIERLQWILTQQRDHFLPLKVIRERLAEWDATGTPPAGDHQRPPADQLPGAPQDEPAEDVRHAATSLAAASAIEVTPREEEEPPAPEVPADTEVPEEPDADEPAGTAVDHAPDGSSLTAEELAARAS